MDLTIVLGGTAGFVRFLRRKCKHFDKLKKKKNL
jgi:hypothetical protein